MHQGKSAHPFLTVQQAADLLQVGPRTIYALITDGVLPATKLGNKYRIKRADLYDLPATNRAAEAAT
jgi:excisionase family DNA binding protein